MMQPRSSSTYSGPFVNSHGPPHARRSAVLEVPRYIRGHHFGTHITNRQDISDLLGCYGGTTVGELSPLFHQRCEVLTFYAMHNLSLSPVRINLRWSCPLLTELSPCTSLPHLDCLTLTRPVFAYVYESPSWLWNTDKEKPGSFRLSRPLPSGTLSVLNNFHSLRLESKGKKCPKNLICSRPHFELRTN